MLKKLLLVITGLFLSVVFLFPTLMLANALQCSALMIRPFSRHAFRRFNGLIAHTWWSLVALCSERLQGVKIVIDGDTIPHNENALLIVNHQGLVDPLPLLCLGYRFGRLADMKYFVKDVLKYVPGVGWGLYFLDNIFLRRNWMKDRASIEKTFARIKSDNIPIWLIAFVEGTRITPKKLAASQEFALKRGQIPLRHLLMPRRKGFVATVAGLSSHLDAIYDITLIYSKKNPSIFDAIFGRLGTVNIHIRRFNIKSLPEGDMARGAWLNQLFVEKDAIIHERQKNPLGD